jgi:chromosome segregation ATPase
MINELSQKLNEKDATLFQMQRVQNQKEAEQNYLANASLVQTYRQQEKKNEVGEDVMMKKMREMLRHTQEVEEELRGALKTAADRQAKIEGLEAEMERLRGFDVYAKEYESMKVLIGKMEEEKFQILDRQHEKLQQAEEQFSHDKSMQVGKVEELRAMLMEKSRQLGEKEDQLSTLRNNFQTLRDEQYETLR